MVVEAPRCRKVGGLHELKEVRRLLELGGKSKHRFFARYDGLADATRSALRFAMLTQPAVRRVHEHSNENAFSFHFTFLLVVFAASFGHAQTQTRTPAVRQRILLDADWHFALGDADNQHRDFDFATVPFFFAKAGYGDGPASSRFDDRTWRTVDLPHDWAVELPFDQRGDGNHGSKAIGRNFPQNSVGWYRKTFTIPKEDLGRRIGIDFDGIYRDAQVWVNGFYLGTEASPRRPASSAANSRCPPAQGTGPSTRCCAAWARHSPSISLATRPSAGTTGDRHAI